MNVRRYLATTVVAAIASTGLVGVATMESAHAAGLGGPVIIGGDDLNDHGGYDTVSGTNQSGWLYIEKALGNIKAKVTRVNDGTLAVLGAEDSTFTGADGGGAAHYTAPKVGLTAEYVNGDTAINTYLDQVAAGTKKPAILYIVGNQSSNDLSSGPGDEGQALADNATTIADFVNGGGGLLSHGTEYRWLTGLLPGVDHVDGGNSGDLYRTPAGVSSFPGVSNADFNAGPWHAYLEGDFGGLDVLVRSNVFDDSSGNDAAVIIGGAAASLPGSIALDPATATNPTGTSHTVTATTRKSDGSLAAGRTVSFSVISGPNSGKTGSGTTNASGTTTFTYTDAAKVNGTDTIQAKFTDDTGTVRTATATKTWKKPANASPVCTVQRFNTTPKTAKATFTDADSDIVKIELTKTVNATWVLDGTAGSKLKTYPSPGTTGKVLTTKRVNNNLTGIVDVRITDAAGHVTLC